MLDFRQIIQDSANIKLRMLETCLSEVESAAEIMLSAIKNGNKILWCGNGGSAADAQHMAAELMGGLRSHSRKPIASIALTTDTSFITAWSNDTSYDEIFSRQIEGLGVPGDVLIAISTSGNSKNVVNALLAARSARIKSIILTGKNHGKMEGMGEVMISVPSDDTQRIQECHLLIEHILCENIEHNI
ncbi:MAG: SIS domain-containing protein [Candidatus Neomarinimicrobiota bacterium]|nr:MAG: phosphoheptose isomerase [Candidatus Marinimicrobia bacterium TMED108]RCL90667.1 MAG: SIS domain-containing protein [bacterium]|tara:strand:+ start:372 stop:935 length:564 start_codon:yes stop_codon:yes gene_type:complete